MKRRRALVVAALSLTAAGLSISLFAAAQQAGEVTMGGGAAVDLIRPPLRPSESAARPPDSFYVDCPSDAHVGVVDLPPDWFNLFVGSYHWKDIVILRNPATKRIEISCIYKDNFSMTRVVSLDYSCARADPGNAFSARVVCDLTPPKPRRKGRP